MTACSRNEAFALAMSFMPNHAASADAAMKGTQKKPAFCSHICLVCSPFTQACGSPAIEPRTPIVITSGTTNCTTDTPRLPRPAFSPSAVPCCAFGKKKLMFDIDEAKFPPPKPQSSEMTRKVE